MTPHANDRAFELLLACSDWPPGEARDQAIRAAATKIEGNWTLFVQLVERHHLAILCSESLQRAGVAPPPALVDLATKKKQRALMLAGETVRLVAMLEEGGCAVVALKGAVLSAQVYDDLAMRQCADIDLLVDWTDFRRAFNLLYDHGYRLAGHLPPWDDWRIEPWRELTKDVTLIDPQGNIFIELHHRLKSPESLLPGLGMAQANAKVPMGGRDMKAFAQADLFAYLCVHAATSFWDRLKWLADVRALVAGMELSEIEQLQRHSQKLGTERCTALGLLLCHRLWGQPIPASIRDWRGHDARLAQLERVSIARLRGPMRDRVSIASTLDRRHLRELRSDAAYRRSQWRELVNDHELLETVHLPREWRALYLPLRILLFVRRKLGLATDTRMHRPG